MKPAAAMIDVITPDTAAAGVTLVAQFWQWVVAALVGLPTVGAMVSNRLTRIRGERSQRSDIAARDATVSGLVDENKRLQAHNAALVRYFEEAQLKIVELQSEIGTMSRKLADFMRDHGGAA